MASSWQPDQPYDALPPLPSAVDLETKVVLKQRVAARAALAELKQVAESIPNPRMLINTLPVLEARASSEIENIVTANKADYYDLLMEVTRVGAWDHWLVYMLRGVEETAIWTTQKIAAIRRLADSTVALVRSRLPKIYSRGRSWWTSSRSNPTAG